MATGEAVRTSQVAAPRPSPAAPCLERSDEAEVRSFHLAGTFVVERWPAGRGRALALAAAAGALGVALGTTLLALIISHRGRRLLTDWELSVTVVSAWLLAAGLVAALAGRAWRDLTLTADRRGLRLRGDGHRQRWWPAEQVARIAVCETAELDDCRALGELRLEVAGADGGRPGVVRLLADRDKEELNGVAARLRDALWPSAEGVGNAAGESTYESAGPAAPALPPAVAGTPATGSAIDRLVDLHRALHRDGRLKPGDRPTADGSAAHPDEEPPAPLLDYAAARSRWAQTTWGPIVPAGYLIDADGVVSATPVAVPAAIPVARRADGSEGHPVTAGAILDYAGPRPARQGARARTRLPATSELNVTADAGGGVTVVETLAGRDGALVAIAFAGVVLAVLAVLAAVAVALGLERRWDQSAILGILFVAEALLMARVIVNTWRKTTVRAGRDGLTVQFESLVSRARHCWPRDRVGAVRVVVQAQDPDEDPVYPAMLPADVQVDITDGPRLHLFTGHVRAELRPLAKRLKEALGPAEAAAAGRPAALPVQEAEVAG